MATKKTPEADVPGTAVPLSEAQVRNIIAESMIPVLSEGEVANMISDMIASSAGKAEHHARASVTSNELQMFAAMAMQGMLANRSNVGMPEDKLARMAVSQADALSYALMAAAEVAEVE